jgi:hypothetical protein
VYNFQEVGKRALELMPDLDPSFEEEKEETIESGSEGNSEPEGKKEQQANPETIEKMKNSLGVSQGLLSELVGPFVFLVRICAQHIAASFWRMEFAQAIEELGNA